MKQLVALTIGMCRWVFFRLFIFMDFAQYRMGLEVKWRHSSSQIRCEKMACRQQFVQLISGLRPVHRTVLIAYIPSTTISVLIGCRTMTHGIPLLCYTRSLGDAFKYLCSSAYWMLWKQLYEAPTISTILSNKLEE